MLVTNDLLHVGTPVQKRRQLYLWNLLLAKTGIWLIFSFQINNSFLM